MRDAGRPGRAAWGAARGGAVDLASLALANRLVGNAAGTRRRSRSSGGATLRVVGSPVMVAVAGAVAAIDVDDGPPVGWGAPIVLPPGAVLRIGRLLQGTRLYLAVRGGLIERLSAGPDAGVGGRIDSAGPAVPAATEAAGSPRATRRRSGCGRAHASTGSSDDAWTTLTTATFQVTALADRVGMRLSGARSPERCTASCRRRAWSRVRCRCRPTARRS